MCGMEVSPEEMTNNGRIDATLKSGKYIYIIECKIDKSANEALNQINDKRYDEKYYNDCLNGYSLIKIGMNFSSNENVRNIDDYLVEC